MTNEEAIKIFNTLMVFGKVTTTKDELQDLCKIAIKALEELEKKEKEKNIKIQFDRIIENAKPSKTYGDIIIVDRKQ